MGRRYLLSKKIAGSQADQILREINELPDVKWVRFSPDMDYLELETKDQEYSFVMSFAVNLCGKAGDGCELSFARFL